MEFKKILAIDMESRLDSQHIAKATAFGEQVIHLPKESPEIKKHIADADCLLVSFLVNAGKEEISNAPKLKYIGVLGTAYGKIDVEYAKSKGILVCNIPGYSTEAVAEFVFAALLERLRELEKGKKQAREGNYSEAGFSASEIKGKIFGILGLGRIGARVAEIALGFGADVRYWSRNRKQECEAKGVKYEDADVLIPKCDFLSLHFALAKDTENFLNEKRIQKIKKRAIVINTAPMELADIAALKKRLKAGDMTFILDHSDEIAEKDLNELSEYKNCVIYPPIAYVTKEAGMAKQEIFVANIKNFLKDQPIIRVN